MLLKIALARTTLLTVVLLAASPARAEEQAVLLHSAPAKAEANKPLRLEGTLVDDDRRISELFVRYRGPGEPYAELPLERQYGDLYRAVIPAEHMVPPGVEYYIEGTLKSGDRVAVFQSAAKPARVIVPGEIPRPKVAVAETPEPPPAASPPPATKGGARKKEPEKEPEKAFDEDEPVAAPSKPGKKQGTLSDDALAALAAEAPTEEPASAPPPARAPAPSSGNSNGRKSAPPPASPPAPKPATTTASAAPAAPAHSPASPAAARPVEPAAPSTPAPPAHSGTEAASHSALEEDLALYSAEDTLALATRHTESVTRVPAIAASFGRDQIRALGARTVADVLDVVPGLSVSRDVQGFYRVGIRGLRNDAEVLFLLNGHRLNNFFDGRALMNLPVENLDRIEVIRGPGSALYGAGAFLGVVNLVTDRSEGVRAAVSGGGFTNRGDGQFAPTLDAHASAASTAGELRLFGDLDVWSQSGDTARIDTDALSEDTLTQNLRVATDPAGTTHDERLLFNVGLGLSYDFGDAGRLTSSLRFLTEDRTALMGLFDTVGPDSDLNWTVGLLDVEYERPLAEGILLRARLYGDQQTSDRLFQLTPDGFRTGDGADQVFLEGLREETRVNVRTVGLGVDTDMVLGGTNRLSAGLVAELQMLANYEYETNYTLDNRARPALAPPDGLVNVKDIANGAAARRTSLGLFVQDQWTVVNPLTLTLGVRADVTQLPTTDSSGAINGTHMVTSLNPRVGLVFAATDSFVLKALYGRAFRPPTLQELVESIPDTDYNQGRFEGNPLLRPATVDTVELGVDLIQAAGESRVRLRGNAFYERFRSPIIPVDTSGNIIPLRNRELGVRVYGVEGEARLEASKRANAWINASFFRAEDLELPSQSRLLTDTPQARFNAGMSMPIGDWVNLDVVVRAGAERRNDTRSVLELIRRYQIPAYSLITAQLRTEPILDHFEVTLSAQNLFDHDLRDDVPRPDRVPGLLPREGQSVYLTVRGRY
ncbi:TonB-dependent receptor plug domain-containing protein [Hyalangium versicolor]|uniref:TonB-dependent receptor plug domain-containing protein n=1 Tax=Hyalangium versicolor TaxID=2861190 RepID=UPI001CCC0D8D|nr:TonB-dependent receptor [Hyalangium versicolor]